MKIRHIVEVCVWLLLLIAVEVHGQSTQQFDISLRIDYSSVEEMLDFFARRTFNADRLTHLQGNQLAASTSLMLARTAGSLDNFTREL